ncbi:alpha/beta fold hydrolase [Tsukamurella strandjordii]|uniref:alpha/beta fold hydrolase n=1 Tax=Tsukamurella TaxID=2060 RepID=UPI001C7D02D2|nr:alpha/beta fold hydrolase [Tsukamurella sp. TY48]GIZ99547.1 ABC transporter ATP-binding protein [Tsukamurella sp. TY48]
MPRPRAPWAAPSGRRSTTVAALIAVLVLVGGLVFACSPDRGPSVRQTEAMLDGAGVALDTSFFVPDGAAGPLPAVLLAHGFGGSKADVEAEAKQLAAGGYAVLTYTARGFGKSTGLVGLDSPDSEVADARKLLDWLSTRPEVRQDGPGDPRVGVAGGSYGGALALLLAGHDRRVDAIAPRITYWNLEQALFPGGVYKKQWAGILFTMGGGCAKFEPAVCEMYNRVAQGGALTDGDRALLAARSPASVGSSIRVPTYLAQGESDSLFPLDHSDEAARRIAENGSPVAMDWIAGGHDGGDREDARVNARTKDWFDRYLKGEDAPAVPAYQVTRTGGIDSETGTQALRSASTDRYPGLEGTQTRTVELTGGPQNAENPPGGAPPSISGVPGLGGSLGAAGALLGSAGLSRDLPAQSAGFESAPLDTNLTVTGAPSITIKVDSAAPDAVLFAKLYDVGPDGSQALPQQLAAPIRIPLAGGSATTTVRLPAIDHEFDAGHRLRVAFSTTDLGYLSPNAPAMYTISATGPLTVPEVPGLVSAPRPLPTWVWALPIIALAVAAALVLIGRRRTSAPADPDLADVALQITGLSKKYAGGDGYSVRDVTFRVDRGQVLGLLGPNGAGKTTTLRMLMGLITPDEGEIRVFGHVIRPGAPVLSRVGAFVEGAGFLPHLSGRANLDLYWRATGRPIEDAHFEDALAIADLGSALDRAVRTYSQGMRQRLAIAQAMLGLPDVLVLDEPTNGLDPSQIREMRAAIVRYGATGRTVIVSSHLLAEVEQTCSHVVVLRRGQLIAAGTVDEIVHADGSGAPRSLEDAFLQLTGGDDE